MSLLYVPLDWQLPAQICKIGCSYNTKSNNCQKSIDFFDIRLYNYINVNIEMLVIIPEGGNGEYSQLNIDTIRDLQQPALP